MAHGTAAMIAITDQTARTVVLFIAAEAQSIRAQNHWSYPKYGSGPRQHVRKLSLASLSNSLVVYLDLQPSTLWLCHHGAIRWVVPLPYRMRFSTVRKAITPWANCTWQINSTASWALTTCLTVDSSETSWKKTLSEHFTCKNHDSYHWAWIYFIPVLKTLNLNKRDIVLTTKQIVF